MDEPISVRTNRPFSVFLTSLARCHSPPDRILLALSSLCLGSCQGNDRFSKSSTAHSRTNSSGRWCVFHAHGPCVQLFLLRGPSNSVATEGNHRSGKKRHQDCKHPDRIFAFCAKP